LENQAQYIAAERSEVWVNIGYRLSAFGFLACDRPGIEGNFGFKDQWMALEWVHDNIGSFGGKIYLFSGRAGFSFCCITFFNMTGDPEDIQVTGLSAGRSYPPFAKTGNAAE